MRDFPNGPAFSTDPPGRWGVDEANGYWFVVDSVTKKGRLIGRIGQPRSHSKINYFDRAMAEAARRNRRADEEQRAALNHGIRPALNAEVASHNPGYRASGGILRSAVVRIPGVHEAPVPVIYGRPCPDEALCRAGDACAGHCRRAG